MPPQPFPCRPDQFAALRTALASQNVAVPEGDSGTISGSGITASFKYDGITLVVTPISKDGWLPTWGMIFDDIRTHIGS